MYRVAEGHFFIAKGVRFAPGDGITEKAFSSKELFLKKVEAGHIVFDGKAAAGADSGKKAAAEKKARDAALKAAKKKREAADKAYKTALDALDIAREELAGAAEDQKPDREKAVALPEAAVADAAAELDEAADRVSAGMEDTD
jgi:hypothetical protein